MDAYEVDEKFCKTDDEDTLDTSLSDEPLSTLVDGLKLGDLTGGTVFEIDPEADDAIQETANFFKDEELLNNLNIEDTGLDDSGDELEPFENLKKKMTLIAEGVYKRVKVKGTGIPVSEKSYVTVQYNIYLEYSDEPFDSTRMRNSPCRFLLNDGAVISGLNIGVATMQAGEISQFLILPEHAFGPMGVPPRIPPNATILCETELISCVDSRDLAELNRLTEDEKKEAAFEKKLNACRSKNKVGNNYFQEKLYNKAIGQYRWALKVLENTSLANEEEESQQVKLLVKLRLNLALCYLTLGLPRQVKIHTRRILDIEPDNTKANYRLGKALRMECEYALALRHLKRALGSEPLDNEIMNEIQKVNRLAKLSRDREKIMCQRMFGQQNPPAVKSSDQKTMQEFRSTMEEYLVNFKNDDSLAELPFSCGFSRSDIECIKEIALSMGFDVKEGQQGMENALKVVKVKDQD